MSVEAHTRFPVASEGRIVENCVRMIAREIEEHNEATGHRKGEQGFLSYPYIPYYRLVQELLLFGTTHDGMSAAVEKCRELGFEPHNNAFALYEEEISEAELAERTVVFPCKVGDWIIKSGKQWQVIGFECDDTKTWKFKLRRYKDRENYEYTKASVSSFGKSITLAGHH